jgi:glycine hydroxymethyltransferase
MKILFVCTANMCRSVMAEALLKHFLSSRTNAFVVGSAGVDVINNLKPDKTTQQLCLDHGLDVSSHRSRQLTKEMIDQSDVVLCLAQEHLQSILSAYPRFQTKVFLLKQFLRSLPVEDPSVRDPIGRPLDHYERCYDEIDEEVKRIAFLLLKDRPEP